MCALCLPGLLLLHGHDRIYALAIGVWLGGVLQVVAQWPSLKAIGYSSSDINTLVEGTLPQHRVTKLSPRPAGPEELGRLFEDAMSAW